MAVVKCCFVIFFRKIVCLVAFCFAYFRFKYSNYLFSHTLVFPCSLGTLTGKLKALKAFVLAHTNIMHSLACTIRVCTTYVCYYMPEYGRRRNALEIKARMESCLYIIYWNVQREYRHYADSLCDVCKINKSYVKLRTVYELHSVERHS